MGDEMLFQAHMITEATTILLHREASELDSSVARNVTSCAPHKAVMPGPTHNVHAAKTIQAAQDISKLIQLPVPLVKHTHFSPVWSHSHQLYVSPAGLSSGH